MIYFVAFILLLNSKLFYVYIKRKMWIKTEAKFLFFVCGKHFETKKSKYDKIPSCSASDGLFGHCPVSISSTSWAKAQWEHNENIGIFCRDSVQNYFLSPWNETRSSMEYSPASKTSFFQLLFTKRQGAQRIIPLYSSVRLSRIQGGKFLTCFLITNVFFLLQK